MSYMAEKSIGKWGGGKNSTYRSYLTPFRTDSGPLYICFLASPKNPQTTLQFRRVKSERTCFFFVFFVLGCVPGLEIMRPFFRGQDS